MKVQYSLLYQYNIPMLLIRLMNKIYKSMLENY